MNKIICIVGMCGAGKSIVADELVEKGYSFIRFGQITLDIVKEKGLEPTEKNEKEIREKLREEHGMGAFATLNIPKFDELLENGKVVADGLYSWSEYKILKEKYGKQMIVLAVYAPPYLRYQRLEARKKIDEKMRSRPITKEQAASRDWAEIENIEKGGPIAIADYTLLNTGTIEDLKESLSKIIEGIEI